MKIRNIGLPEHLVGVNPFLPNEGDGTAGDTNGGAGGEAEGQSDGSSLTVQGYPKHGRPDDMTVDQMAAFYKHQMQRAQDHNKPNAQKIRDLQARLSELEPKAQQYEALAQSTKTEAERAVEDAEKRGREAGRAEADATARSTFGARLVEAEFVASLAGRMDRAAVSTLVSKLNVAAFLDDTGAVSTEAVAEYVSALPAPTAQQTTTTNSAGNGVAPSIGQGVRRSQTASGLNAGEQLWASRHAKTRLDS